MRPDVTVSIDNVNSWLVRAIVAGSMPKGLVKEGDIPPFLEYFHLPGHVFDSLLVGQAFKLPDLRSVMATWYDHQIPSSVLGYIAECDHDLELEERNSFVCGRVKIKRTINMPVPRPLDGTLYVYPTLYVESLQTTF